jgi:hypothetical protein
MATNKFLTKVADMGVNPSSTQGPTVLPQNPIKNNPHRDLLNTGVIGSVGFGVGGATAALAHKLKLKPMHAGILGGAVGLVGDYGAVKVNNMINNHLDKKASEMNKYLEKIAKIEINPDNKGLLHKKMGRNPNKPIPTSALQSEKSKAQRSGNVKLEREAQFAINARKWKHK